MSRTRSETVALYAAAAAFPASALSISGTHICLGLAFAAFGWDRGWRAARGWPASRSTPTPGGFGFQADWPTRAIWSTGGALFLWFAASTLCAFFSAAIDSDAGQSASEAIIAQGRRAVRGELGDVALFLFGLLVFRLSARDSAARQIFSRALSVAVVLLVLSGFAALFSEFRLARLVPHLIREALSLDAGGELIASAGNRPQHPLLNLAGVQLYRPIGFMNTRLTYAGLLALALPWAAGRLWHFAGSGHFRAAGRPAAKGIAWGAVLALGLGLLMANGTRSVLFGVGLALGLGVLVAMLRAVELSRQTDSPGLMAGHRGRLGAWLLLILLPLLILGGGMTALLSETGQLQLRRALARVERHTDYARPILWTQAADFAVAHPLVGVGPGNFERAGEEYRAEFLQRYPHTWYFLKNTPRGHAHNDLLHLAAVGGLPAGLAYLLLLAAVASFLLTRPGESPAFAAAAGTMALFFAGLAQCYFQDDEVSVLFWGLLGLASALRDREGDPGSRG